MSEEMKETTPRTYHRHSDQLSNLVWALILIWAGLVFLAENMNWLSGLAMFSRGPAFGGFHFSAWTLVFAGAGVIVLIEVVVRMLVPTYASDSITGRIIFAAVLLGIGLGNMFGWNLVWPLILIGAGASVLLGGYRRRL